MKKVLGWVKSNLVIVIALVLAIIAIPAMLFFSNRWNQSIREEVSADVSNTMRQLSALPVTYDIPAMMTGGEAWQSDRVAPNRQINERMEAVLRRLSSDAERVRDIAIERNQAGRTPLIDGLFPSPSNENARVGLLTDMTRERPGAYAALLEQARAGMPPEADGVKRTLEARRARLVQEVVQGRVEQDLSEEEAKEIQDRLSEERLEIYTNHASRLSFYAAPEAFIGVRAWRPDEGLPSIETAWEWQMDLWVAQDIVAAIEKANSGPSGWLPVAAAPVKQVIQIDIEGAQSTDTSAGGGGRGFEQPEAGALPTDPNAPIEPVFSVAFTGRAGHPTAPNALYDVRYATIEMIVDVNRLPAIINAFSTTNFSSVIDLDFEAIDPHDAMERGLVFGGDYVARATLRVETVWLRSWRKQWMPPAVRQQLGIPDDPETPAEDGEETP